MATALADLELPEFDYNDPELRGERFHSAVAAIGEQSWIASAPLAHAVFDREACDFFLRTKKAIFPGVQIGEIFGVTEGPLHEEMQRNIINIHGEDHRRLRVLVNPSLNPRAVQLYRPALRRILLQLLDSLSESGECEFVEQVAKPYPTLMIAELMGVPAEDAPRLYNWAHLIQQQFDPSVLSAGFEQIDQAVVEFYDYVDLLIERRRAQPRDDLISKLIAAEEDGDRLSDVELRNLVLNVLVGAVDAMQAELAQAMRLLAEHPDQWQALRANPELVSQAANEVLRFEPINPFTVRLVTEPVEYRDVVIPENTILMLCVATANREPTLFERPNKFDITLDRGDDKVMSFGAGVHYCMGASLARVELEEALDLLLERYASVELTGEPQHEPITGVYGLASLPLRLVTA